VTNKPVESSAEEVITRINPPAEDTGASSVNQSEQQTPERKKGIS